MKTIQAQSQYLQPKIPFSSEKEKKEKSLRDWVHQSETREWEKDTTQFSVQFNSTLSLNIHHMWGIFITTLDRLVINNNNKKHNVYSPVMKLITSIQ